MRWFSLIHVLGGQDLGRVLTVHRKASGAVRSACRGSARELLTTIRVTDEKPKRGKLMLYAGSRPTGEEAYAIDVAWGAEYNRRLP